VPTAHRRTVIITLCALTLLVSGCGGGGETSAPTTAANTPPSSSASQTYSSKAFVVPFTVTVDAAALKSPPNPDSPNLLSWDAAASDVDNAVRFFVPVIVYPQAVTPRRPRPRTT
jgi:hypothetical protein